MPFPNGVGSYYSTESESANMFHSLLQPTCSDFFTVFTAGVSAEAQKVSCSEPFKALSDRFEVWNEQMAAMNTTLAIYTNFHDGSSVCHLSGYPNLQLVHFDEIELFVRHNLSDAYKVMKKWPGRPTRVADVMRLLIAHETHRTYIDMDIIFVDMHKAHFMYPFAGAAIFQDNKNAIELTNSAFCLPQVVLQRMVSFVDRRIRLGSQEYFYTELGPSMFHKVIFNQYPAIALYSQNNPAVADLDRLARETLIYSHRMLHLSGHVRKGHPEFSFKELTLAIKEKINSVRKQLKRR